jgi:two-component system, chemotaxis family, CheB/CheR fusion protein
MARYDAEFCRVLAENIREIAIISLDPAGIIDACNTGAEVLLGYRDVELIGKHISEIYTPADAKAGLPAEHIKAAQEESQDSDVLLKRKNGTVFQARCILAPVPAAGGGVRGYVKVLRDDTGRKRFEQLLMWSRIFAEGIVDSVREPLIVLDAKLRIMKLNRAFSRMFKGAVLKDDCLDLSCFQDGAWNHETLLSKIREILEKDSSFEDYFIEREFDSIGKRCLHLSGTRLYCEGTATEMVLLSIEDFTERHRLERDLKERVQQLNILDRRKDEFLATLAHELRSPLAPIRSAVNVLLLNKLPQNSSQRATAIIERQVGKMSRLIEDLLDIARIQQDKIELQREFLDLKVVIAGAIESTESLIADLTPAHSESAAAAGAALCDGRSHAT